MWRKVHFICGRGIIQVVCWWALAVVASAQVPELRFNIPERPGSNDWLRLSSSLRSNSVLTLDASSDLSNWWSIGTLHDALRSYPDVSGTGFQHRFYRLRAQPRTATNDWKNEILFPAEVFRSAPNAQQLRWVKFAILATDPTRVYYQDTAKFPFHFQFATQRLPQFLGMEAPAFDAISLHRTNQQVILGTVLFPPGANYVEFGVQFAGREAYEAEEIASWMKLVGATVFASNGAGIFYMPAFEQGEMTRTNAEALAARGIAVASLDRWLSLNHVYSAGWAWGRLKYFAASEITSAYSDGRLRPDDVLLTDGVPAETPLVAGIISLTPSTPNSHTALLSQGFGIPFVYLPDAEDRAVVQALVGRRIMLRATVINTRGLVKVLDVESGLTPEHEAELRSLKQAEPIRFAGKKTFGAWSASTEALMPSDIQYFGGKAANYGILRRAVPSNSPPAIAFSFDLWDAFLDQTLPGGETLRGYIHSRLAPYTNYPPDIPSLKTNLAAIRDVIRRTATFTPAQKAGITNALSVFTPQRNIRFRSSTNVEDSEHFTGAGLYDSYSGCLLDDLDGDTTGPSACDPSEANERGVFRAMQRVYASFYNDSAFLARLRHGVDETQVGMAALVHHSFPDREEMANGVATIRFAMGVNSTNVSGSLVSQVGANSVTNPDGTSIPEVVEVSRFFSTANLTLTRHSSFLPLGGYVMDWQDDYRGFVALMTSVAHGFRQAHPSRTSFHLDFEYKKDVNLGLVLKQVREVPPPSVTNRETAFLINEPTTYCVSQSEFTDAFANHRLKMLWTLETTNMRLTASNIAHGLYTHGHLQFVSNGTLQVLSGPMSNWPGASNAPDGKTFSWKTGHGPEHRSWRLNTMLLTNVSGEAPPIVTQQDFSKNVAVDYAQAVPRVFNTGVPGQATNESVKLEPCPRLMPGSLLQERTFASNAVNITTRYYWPPPPMLAAGYTAPLVRFVETRITGLTTTPILLTNYFSQTYHPTHHNFTEEFIFEPRLEPGLPAATLEELHAANIQLLYVFRGYGGVGSSNVTIRVLDLDQKFRGF